MQIMKKLILFCLMLSISIATLGQSKALINPKYNAEDGTIMGYNINLYNNRPLYINNSNAFILTGDKPIARLVKDQSLFGTFMVAIERKGKAKWLQQCDQINSIYHPGRMEWKITDALFPDLKISLEILPMSTVTGMAICAKVKGVHQGDKLIWIFGGAKWYINQNLSWKFDVMGQPELLNWGFMPEECNNNIIERKENTYLVSLIDSTKNVKRFTVAGNCSSPTTSNIREASLWSNAIKFINSKSQNLPIQTGIIALNSEKSIYWTFEAFMQLTKPVHSLSNNPQTAFKEGFKRTQSFQNRLKIKTPDPYLNAVAQGSVAAVDGTWYSPVFVHGAMQWNNRLPGWRTIFGGTMYGWHDRVRKEAKFYTDAQITVSDKKEAKADPATLLTEQHHDSRYYGIGRINKDQDFYDMQTQFFDQIIEEYRWTADPELINFFRQALELHLHWMRDCFDPDGDGVYESYINTWPTDSQWYNGGGTAEETSYAYRGHLAARDMARNAGDIKAEKYHDQMLEKIKKGFFEKLWIKEKGYPGAYREQGGHERLHEDPWLYSIFLPIDAGLTSQKQAVESVYYTEWALQNDHMPVGGRRVWTSNWTPSIWSVREMWPGDNYHLALSYFQAGLPNDGWDIMRGTFMYSAFNHISPGNLGSIQGGIDFGDCVHTFTRTLVSGLFGYNPDYPNGKVKLSPQFPTDWNDASIEVPDVKIEFHHKGSKINYHFELAHTANMEILLPIMSDEVKNVIVNGKKTKWELIPGLGRNILQLYLPESNCVEVVIETGKQLPYNPPLFLDENTGNEIKLRAKDAQIIAVEDPQQILSNIKIVKGEVVANLVGNKGYHTIITKAVVGKAVQFIIFRIKINNLKGDTIEGARFVQKIPNNAKWEVIDISTQFNADITTIYQQKYLSPRPNTVSVRLGTDGYSPWTFPHWKSKPPVIKMDNIKKLRDSTNRLITPQGVPFSGFANDKNITFTSLWDNYPSKVDFPIHKTGRAIYFLISGSTNIMQCQIANAVIRLNYADGKTDSLLLIPPVNYWNLSTIDSHATAPGQGSRTDYTSEIDRFCLPGKLPETVQLGENCRAMLLNLKLRQGIELKSITLETLSQEVVVGLMGLTIMK